jgi:cobalt-zinc-cadmium efflux system outer membrane protein
MLGVVVLAAAAAIQQGQQPVTIDAALARALAERPQVAAAAAAAAAGRAAQRIATAIPSPALQFESDKWAPTRKLSFVQPLGWLPRRGSDAAAGRALAAAGWADSARIIAELGADVRRAFYRALAARELASVADEQVRIADSLIVLGDRRVSAGDIAQLERDQIAQDASLVRLQRSRASADARSADLQLRRAIAWDGTGALAISGDLAAGLDDPMPASFGESSTDPPSVRVARYDSAVAAARLRSARIAQIPVPGLLVGSEWGGDVDGSNTLLGFALPLPIWSFGREAVAQADAAARAGAARAAEATLTVDADIAAARVRYAEAADRARLARDSLRAESTRIRVGAVRLYEEGRSDVLRVFDALRAERDVAGIVITELLAFQLARAELLALLGQWE